jgi:hypothetical protein
MMATKRPTPTIMTSEQNREKTGKIEKAKET